MPDLLTIAEAADTLGCKPGDVDRLIDRGQLRVATLVDASSVAEVAGVPADTLSLRARAEAAEAKLERIETQWREMVRTAIREDTA